MSEPLASLISRPVENINEFRTWLNYAEAFVRSLPDRSKDGTEGTNTHNSADLARVVERLHDLANEYALEASAGCKIPGQGGHPAKAEVLGTLRLLAKALTAAPATGEATGVCTEDRGDDGPPPCTLEQLITELEYRERPSPADAANAQEADRIREKDGALAAAMYLSWCSQINARSNLPCFRGLGRIELLCDQIFGGTGLTIANVRQIRAQVCQKERCQIENASQLNLDQVADILEGPNRQRGEPEGDPGGVQDFEDLFEVKTAGYRPSTELGRIVSELNNPPRGSPANPGELEEVPNPCDDARRPWLPILKECINKIPELASSLTVENLRNWLRQKYKLPPTADLRIDQLVELLEHELAAKGSALANNEHAGLVERYKAAEAARLEGLSGEPDAPPALDLQTTKAGVGGGTPPTAEVLPDLLSASELANRLGQNRDAVESFLRRYRGNYPDCYLEGDARRRNTAKYIYRVAEVLPDLKQHFGIK